MEQYVLKKKPNGDVIHVSDVQSVLLEMLKDIHEVCREHEIPYFLNGGSALGAYRHHGFIPWDDDIDIAMMDNDYERFVTVVSQELSKSYIIDSYELKKCYNVCIPAMKIRKKNTFVKEMNTLLKNKCKDSDGLFIDIFVYSHVSDRMIIDLPFRLINVVLMPFIILFENIGINPIPLKNVFKANAKLYGKLMSNSKYIGFDLTWTFKNPLKPFRFKKADIYPTQYLRFEDIDLPVPNNLKAYLATAIAPTFDELPSVDQRKPKHIIDVNLKGDKP